MTNSRSIVLVADTVKKHTKNTVDNRTLEFTEEGYLDAVTAAIKSSGYDVTHFDSPGALVDGANNMQGSVVVSLWSGADNRSRRTYVPSTCDSIGMPYIGADAYTAIVCQDKDLSKSYAKRYGILAPVGTVVEVDEQIIECAQMTPPFVVKPLLEGGSIGIDQRALCKSWKDVMRQVSVLQRALQCPVLVEEFLEGDEVSICLMGRSGSSARFAAVQVEVEGFDLAKGIWSMELKKTLGTAPRNVPVTAEIDKQLEHHCRSLFDSFEKIDYMRIDGRITKEGFRLIELTPDVHLGPGASFAQAMMSTGISYEEMWAELVSLGTP